MLTRLAIDTRGTTATGQTVEQPKAQGYNLRINDIWFRTIAKPDAPLQIGTRDSLAERQDRSGSIYENVLDIGYAWSRTDLSGGEGLDWDPRELALFQDKAAFDQMRYFSSNNIDVSRPAGDGEQYKLRLSHAQKEWSPSFTDLRDLTMSSTYIYTGEAGIIKQIDSWEDATDLNSWDTESSLYALVASPNDTLMYTAANGEGYVKGPLDADFTQFYKDSGGKLKARGVWFVHGRFIMSAWDDTDNAVLWQVAWNGTEWKETEIDTASSPFWSVVESGPAVVAACGDGTLRTYTPDNAQGGTFELTPRGRTSVPEGEQPILLGSNAGVLLVLTTADTDKTADLGGPFPEPLQAVRLYQGEVLDGRFDYTVGQLQLRRTWFATTHEPLETRNMTATRDEIWWFVREFIDDDFSEALWRFDVVTNGLSRNTTVPGKDLNGLIVFDSIFGGIDFAADTVIISDLDTYQDMGWMVFSNVTFGLNTDISWIATILEASNLTNQGTQVELWRTSNPQGLLDWQDPSWILIQRLSSPGGTNLELPLINVKSRTLALQLRIFNHSEETETPHVTRLALRGIPAHRDFLMQIPVNISDYVSVPGRQPSRVPGLGYTVHNKILSLIGSNVECVLIDPPVLFEGIVNNISEPIEYLSNRGSTTTYVMVEFRGKRSTTIALATGDAGLGLGIMGLTLMGIGQTERT